MSNDWVEVYRSSEQAHVLVIQAMLKDNGIEVIAHNLQDSMYPSIGEVQLSVPAQQRDEALRLIEQNR